MFWSEFRALFKLGMPMVATQFFIMAMGFMDTAMAGHYASVDLAGVALGGNIIWPIFMLMAGLNMALTPMAAHLRGEKKIEQIGPLARQGLWLAVFSSIITILIIINASPVFAWFEVDQSAAIIGDKYLKATAWGIPALMLYVTLRYVCEGLGHTIEPMLIAASTLVVNGFLNYVFIYGKFGMPEMGGEGCGWASALTMWFELVVISGLVFSSWFRETGLINRFEWLHFANIASIVKIGLPIGLTLFLEMAVFSFIGLLVGSLGISALAAHSIAGNISWATYVIPSALGAAASIRIGFYVGTRDLKRARQVVKTAFLVSIAYALFASSVLILLREVIPGIYSTDPAVLGIASGLLLIVAIYQIADCTQATMVGTLRGYKDTRVSMIYSFIGYWLLSLPLGMVLAFGYFGPVLGVSGFWIALAIGLSLVCLLVGHRLYQTSRDERRILEFAQI